MSEALLARDDARPVPALPAGPLVWQRTGTVGTELVFPESGEGVRGTVVVAGNVPYAAGWRAVVGSDAGVRDLSVTCRSGDGERTVGLRHTGTGWECETGGLPGPGTPIEPAAVLRLADSPIFVTWAIRRLGLTAEAGPVCVPSVRVLTPTLEVVAATATFHLLSPQRLRVTGDGPAVTYELDRAGLVTYQPGHLRLAR